MSILILERARTFSLHKPLGGELWADDIAWPLARICRFGGRLPKHGPMAFYSVADHSVLVALILREFGEPASVQYAGLMHDAHEALMGDIVTPVKRWLAIEEKEAELAQAVCERFGVCGGPAAWSVVKVADLTALYIECKAMEMDVRAYFASQEMRAKLDSLAPDLSLIQREGLLVPNLCMSVDEVVSQSAGRFMRWFRELADECRSHEGSHVA